MAQSLENAGISLENQAAGLKSGLGNLGFMDSPVYERFAALSDETFDDLSRRTGTPLNLLMLIREAAGGAVPNPTDRVREDELAVVPWIQAELGMGFRPVSVERTLRVLGDAMRRVATTESTAWRTDLMERIIASGGTSVDLANASSSADTELLGEVGDKALLAIWHAQQGQAWAANIIGGFEKALTEAGLLKPETHPPAICFLDITGYTRLTGERGDEAAADLAEVLGRLVSRSAFERGGRPIKWLGDGVMLHFPDPGPGVLAALDMVDGVTAAGLPPAHVGIHAGPVLFQQGDYFGQTVNLAARIADYARPGEVLVTQEVVEASSGDNLTFSEIGPVELKGIRRSPPPLRAPLVDELGRDAQGARAVADVDLVAIGDGSAAVRGEAALAVDILVALAVEVQVRDAPIDAQPD